MYTQCPQCDTLFSLQAWQLQKAAGRVRCGVCEHTFNALEALSDTPPDGAGDASADELTPEEPLAAEPPPADPPESETAPADPLQSWDDPAEGVEPDRPEALESIETPGAEAADGAVNDPLDPLAADDGPLEGEEDAFSGLEDLYADRAPPYSEKITEELFEQWAAEGMDFTRRPPRGASEGRGEPASVDGEDAGSRVEVAQADDGVAETESGHADAAPPAGRARRGWGRTVLWSLVLLVLTAAAVLQATWLFRDEMATQPWLRGWVEGVCEVLGCSVAAPFEPEHIEVTGRFLEAHPQQDGYLVLGATLVNRHDRPIRYPEVLVELEDLDGHATGAQWFTPHRYLGDGRLRARLDRGMPPGQEIPLRLVFEAPEAGADSFSMEFRPPDA